MSSYERVSSNRRKGRNEFLKKMETRPSYIRDSISVTCSVVTTIALFATDMIGKEKSNGTNTTSLISQDVDISIASPCLQFHPDLTDPTLTFCILQLQLTGIHLGKAPDTD